MSTATVYSAIKTFLDANWTTTSLVYENTATPLPDTPASFVEVEITGNSYAQASIGSGTISGNLWRENGLLWLHVMVPSGTGSLTARTYAETLIKLLRGQEIVTGLTFGEASVGLGDPSTENGNYWRLSISVEWQYDS